MDERIIQNFMKDLETATTIAFFEMREEELSENGVILPANINYLRKEAVKRNIIKLEADISSANTEGYRNMRQEQLNNIKTQYKSFL